MKRILLPTDFSINSMNAITYAMELFENMPCVFVLLNIQKPSQFLTHEIITANPEQSLFDAISEAILFHKVVTKITKKWDFE